MRLSAPPGARLSNASALSPHVGGAEANVAAMLAQLGHETEMVSVLPASPLGDWCEAELRRTGLATHHSIRADGRLGLYFSEGGADSGRVFYDRSASAFAAAADQFDWPALTSDAQWFHLSGITLLVSEVAAKSAIEAVEAMRAAGATVSFDVNHRSSLWDARRRERMHDMVAMADVLFAGAADISRILETDLPCDTVDDRRRATEAALAAFDRLQLIASTRRTFDGERQQLTARLDRRDASHETAPAPLRLIVDRIGSGDAFAAAVIDSVLSGATLDTSARQGLAAAIQKHAIAGDRWIGSRDELDAFDPFAPADIRR